MAYLTPDLVQKGLSISSSFAKGGTVAAFQEGGQVSEDDLAAAVTEADDLNEALDNLSERDSGDDYEETVAAALAGGKDLNEALDFADDVFGDGGDGAAAPSPAPRDDGRAAPIATTQAAELADQLGVTAAPGIAEALLAQQATRPVAPVTAPERETVTEKALQVDEFGPLFDTPATRPTVPAGGIGAVLTEGYDMAGRPTIPGISDDDVDQGAADVGALAKELGIDVKDVDFRERGLADLLKPGGIIKDIGGLFTGEGALKEAAAGGQVVKNEKGETVGVVSYDDEGKVSRVTPVGIKESFDPALRDAYRDFYANQPEERDSDGGEPILPEDVAVEEEAAPEKPPTIDIVPFRQEDFYYFNPQSRYPYGLTSLMNMRNS